LQTQHADDQAKIEVEADGDSRKKKQTSSRRTTGAPIAAGEAGSGQ